MPNGVFSKQPYATPKYGAAPTTPNFGARMDGFQETMARLYIKNVPDAVKTKILNALTEPAKTAAAKLFDGYGYHEFLVQDVITQYSEHASVNSGLGDVYIPYAFGTEAPTFRYSGVFLNNKQDDQAANFDQLYRTILRASKSGGHRFEVSLQYDEKIIHGTMTSLSWSLRADDESTCPFNFSLLVRNVELLPDDVYDSDVGTPSQLDQSRLAGVLNVSTKITVRPITVARVFAEAEEEPVLQSRPKKK